MKMKKESYLESCAFMRDKKKGRIIMILCVIACPVLLIGGFFLIFLSYFYPDSGSSYLLPIIMGILCFVCMVILWLKKDVFLYDYDYILVEGDIKVVKVVNKRKRVLEYEIYKQQITDVGRCSNKKFKAIEGVKGTKITALTPNKRLDSAEELFYIKFSGAKGEEIVLLECGEEFIYALAAYLNKSVYEEGLK